MKTQKCKCQKTQNCKQKSKIFKLLKAKYEKLKYIMSDLKRKSSVKFTTRSSLTIRQKYELISLHENQNVKPKQLLRMFPVGKTQLYRILQDRDKFKKIMLEAKLNVDRKKIKPGKHEVINEMTYEWYKKTQDELDSEGKGEHVTGQMIKKKAMEFVNVLGIDGFKASSGWLYAFVNRHGINRTKTNTNKPEVEDIPANLMEAIFRTDDIDILEENHINNCSDATDPLMLIENNEHAEDSIEDISNLHEEISMTEASEQLKRIQIMLHSKGKSDLAKRLQVISDEIEAEITIPDAIRQIEKINKMLKSKNYFKIADKLTNICNELEEINCNNSI